MKNRSLRKSCAVLLAAALFTPMLGRSLPPYWMPTTAPGAVAISAVAGRGGIQVCLAKPAGQVRAVEYDEASGSLRGRLADQQSVQIPIALDQAQQLALVAAHAAEGCVEVSIDPIADGTHSFSSAALQEAPDAAQALLRLDSEIGRLLEGGAELPAQALSGTATPPIEAKRLLDARDGDPRYRALVQAYAIPPFSCHSSTITVDPTLPEERGLRLQVNPTVQITTPDGRRVRPEPKVAEIATLPYAALARRLEAAPRAFTEPLPHLDRGLHIARAFALLAACAGPACRVDLPRARHQGRPQRTIDPSVIAERESMLHSTTHRVGLTSVWREHRLSLKPQGLSQDARVAMFVDEAIQWFSSLESSHVGQRFNGAPQQVLALVEGQDTSASRYAGWVDLGRFIVGTWAGRPLPDLIDALNRAYSRADRDSDHSLRYQILRSVENLLTVVDANVRLGRQADQTPAPLSRVFDPWQQAGAMPLEAEVYLSYLAERVPAALNAHLQGEYARAEAAIAGLYRGDDPTGDSDAVQQAYNVFTNAHLMNERRRVVGSPIVQLARLNYAAGLAFARENNRGAALDQARLLDSLRGSVGKSLPLARQTELARWALRIRDSAARL